MLVGWKLPACVATLAVDQDQREVWKSIMYTIASSSDVCSHWPLPEFSRSSSATRMPLGREDPGAQIGDRDADAHRALPGSSGDRHQSAHALRDLVEARARRERTCLAEAGDAGVYQARVAASTASRSRCRDGTSRRAGNSRRPRPRMPIRRFSVAMPSGLLEVQRDGALVPVRVLVVGAVLSAQACRRRACVRASAPG